MQDPGGPVDAEAALARPHPQADRAPDVVQVDGLAAQHGRLQATTGNELAFADQLVLVERGLPPFHPRSEPVVPAGLGVGQGFVRGPARVLHPDLRAQRVDGVLGHKPERAELPTGDREEPLHTVPLPMVQQRVRPGDVARVGSLGLVLKQGPDPAPHAERPGPAEPRDQVLARVHHLLDLVPGDLPVVGIGHLLVRRPDRVLHQPCHASNL